jgi:hypothetical protein
MKNIRDGLDPPVRMPRKTLDIVLRVARPKIIEKQEWIERGDLAEAEGPFKVNTGSLDRGFALQDFPDFPG